METPPSLPGKRRMTDLRRSVAMDTSPLVPNPNYVSTKKIRRGSTVEFTSISSMINNDFIRLGSTKYGKLLSSLEKSPEHENEPTDQAVGDRQRLCVEIYLERCTDGKSVGLGKVAVRKTSPYVVPLLRENNKATTTQRILRRKDLFSRRRTTCNLCVGLVVAGLIIMVTDMEIGGLNLRNASRDWELMSLLLKLMIVSTTVVLILSLIAYKCTEIQIYLMETGADDWRVAMTAKRIIFFLLEILICALCPLPGIDYAKSTHQDHGTTPALDGSNPPPHSTWSVSKWDNQVPLNVLLSIPMFARSYWVCRLLVLHRKQFQDASMWSIASLNHVTVNFKFVAKTLLSEQPLMVLGIFTFSTCCCTAWMLAQCERYYGCEGESCCSYADSLWLVIITLLAIGYGDVVPRTHCGRFVAIFTGIAGMGVSAALISVMSRKIGLTRSEKQVNSFVTDSKLANGIRNAAAAVLQETWFIHKYKNGQNLNSRLQVVRHQRKFLQAVTRFRSVKLAQKNLREKQFEFVDIRKAQHEVQEIVLEMQGCQVEQGMQLHSLTKHLKEAHQTLKVDLQEAVSQLQQNQSLAMTEMGMLQRSMGDIHIQLSSLSNQLNQIVATAVGINNKVDEV